MNTLVVSSQEIAQDIKSNDKKYQKLKSPNSDDLFGTLISNLLQEETPTKNGNFLINKMEIIVPTVNALPRYNAPVLRSLATFLEMRVPNPKVENVNINWNND